MAKVFIKNIIINNTSQGLLFGSKWLLTITLLKVLSIETFAVFSFIYTFSNILISILPFGSHIYLISKGTASISGLKELGLSINIILTLFFFIIFLYFLFIILGIHYNNKDLILLGILLSFFSSINTVFFSFLKGIGNFVYELKIYTIFSILTLSFTCYLYFINTLSLSIILIILISINFLITVLIFKYSPILNIKYIYEQLSFNYKDLKKSFSKQFYFGLQEIVTASFTQGGILIIFYIISNQDYTEYRAMLLLTAPFALINIAFSQVLLSHLKKVPFNNIGTVFRNIQIPFTIAIIIILILFYFLGASIVKLITGLEYTSSIHKAYLGVLWIILTSFVYAGYEMLLVVINKQKYRFIIMLIGATVNIISIFIFLPDYGIVGAILTNVFANFVVFIGIIIIAERAVLKLVYTK